MKLTFTISTLRSAAIAGMAGRYASIENGAIAAIDATKRTKNRGRLAIRESEMSNYSESLFLVRYAMIASSSAGLISV